MWHHESFLAMGPAPPLKALAAAHLPGGILKKADGMRQLLLHKAASH
jgi:hypothetical protein